MRTRIVPKCCVRQYAHPRSPLCSVGASCDQSVVPNGMSDICTRDSFGEKCLTNEANRPAAGPVEREVRRLHRRGRPYHSGLLRFFANEENIRLKLMLILSSSPMLVSTECSR